MIGEMRRDPRTRRLLALTGVVAVLLATTPAARVMADQLQDDKNKQTQINNGITQNQQQIQTLQGQEAQLALQLNTLNGEIQTAEVRLGAENAKLDAINGQIDETQRQLDAKRAEQVREQQILNQRNRILYKQGGDSKFMDSLFTANSFSDLMNRYILMTDVTHANQVLVSQIKQDKDDIEQLLAQQSQQRDAQAVSTRSIRDQTNALQAQYIRQSALRAQLHGQELSLEARVAAAKAALAQVNSEIAALQAARGRAHSSGVFAWPGVQGPITQDFGCTDFAGEPPPPSGYTCPRSRPYFHTGIDIAGPYGSEIDATDGGIAYTYPGNYGYGNHVIIIHANGFASLYGHMASGSFAVTSGQAVVKGQRIGAEGSTGFSTGAHLHFEIRLNDTPVDPCRYVGC